MAKLPRFSTGIKEEVKNPDRTGKRILFLMEQLGKISRAFQWKSPRKVTWHYFDPAYQDFLKEAETDALSFEMARAFERCRNNPLSAKLTEKTARRVLNRVKNALRKEVRRRVGTQRFEEAQRALETGPLFQQEFEAKVVNLELLVQREVIDELEYYFFLALKEGYRLEQAAVYYGCKPNDAALCVFRARPRVIKALEELEAGRLPTPRSKRGRRRKIDKKRLYRAIHRITTK